MGQLCPDATLCINKDLCAAGKPKLRKALVRVMSGLTRLVCEPALIWAKGTVGVIEADIVCDRMDGARTAFPVTAVLCLRGRLIAQVHLFTYEPEVRTSFFTH